jgi:N-acyl-D-amino-acid deacylase
MRLGASLESGRAEGEVKYYMPDGTQGRSVFSNQTEKVPEPYGAFCLEAMDSHGGWLASAVDLARFVAALDAPGRSSVLKSETCRLLYEPPAAPVSRKPDGALTTAYYACGWQGGPSVLKGITTGTTAVFQARHLAGAPFLRPVPPPCSTSAPRDSKP